MSLYNNSKYPVRSDLDAIHEAQIGALGDPGTWLSGAQRLAIAQEARAARCEADLQQAASGAASPSDDLDLAPAARRLARRLAVAPADFTQADYSDALSEGLTDAEYVEIVGLVSRVTDFDALARGIGVRTAPLPAPKQGEPTRQRRAEAVLEGAWAPTIPNGSEGGESGQLLYGGRWQPFIIRSLSLVPDELRLHLELEQAQYLPLARFREFDYQHHEGLTRPQVEVIAGRVSALNECFY